MKPKDEKLDLTMLSDDSLARSFAADKEPAETVAATPRMLGRFELLERVGAGAFGEVWKARDTNLGRIVAVKLLHKGLVSGQADRERFFREARAAANLRHPGIVPLHEVAELDGIPAIVSAFVAGVTLKELLAVRRLDLREAAVLASDVAYALDYAHSMKLVHRDVKPANIMVEFGHTQSLSTSLDVNSTTRSSPSRSQAARSGATSSDSLSTSQSSGPRPLLVDFGLALREDVEATMTADGQILGTPAYMSPEQATGEGHYVDRRSDIYSLGVVLYELLTGDQPFRGSKVAIIHQVIHDDPPTPRALNPIVPRDLETICLKAMAKSKATRYPTAAEFAADLRRWLNDEPILARRPTIIENLRRWTRRHPGLAASISFFFISLIVIANVSSFAAIRFRTLAEENDRARLAADDARKLAVSAQHASEDVLFDMYTAFGLESSDMGQPAFGLPWFVAAAELQHNSGRNTTLADQSRSNENQLRFQNWTRLVAIPVRAWFRDATDNLSGIAHKLQWHSSGKMLLVQSFGKLPEIWDLESVTPRQFTEEVSNSTIGEWSPDGKWLVLGSPSGRVDLIDVSTWRPMAGWSQTGPITSLAWNDEGRLVAAGSDCVRVWDCDQREFVTGELAHAAAVVSIRFSQSSDRIVTASNDGSAYVYPIRNGPNPQPLFPPVTYAKTHFLAPLMPRFVDMDRKFLTQLEDGELVEWSAANGERNEKSSIAKVTSFQASPSGMFGALFEEFEGRLLNLSDGEFFGRPINHTNHVTSIAFRPDQEALATSSYDRTVRIWSTVDGQPLLPPIEHQGELQTSEFSPDGRYLATAQHDGLIRIWLIDLPRRTIEIGGYDSFIEMSQDGKYAFCGPWESRRGLASVQAFELASGKPAGPEFVVGSLVNGAFFSPQESMAVILAAAPGTQSYANQIRPVNGELETNAGQILFFDWRTGQTVHERLMTASEPIAADWSPDGKSLVVLCAKGQILFVDASTGQVLHHCDQGSKFTPFFVTRDHVRFAPDGRSVATWSDSVIKVWDATSAELKFEMAFVATDYLVFTHDAVFSSDSKLLAIATSDKKLRIINVETGQPAAEPLSHPDWVFSACFTNDGKRILTACRDGQARLWDWQTGKLVCPALVHADEVFDVAITPDSRWLITASRDSTIRIWDAVKGKPITPPIRNQFRIKDICVSPDGQYLLASGSSSKLLVFDLPKFVENVSMPLDLKSQKLLGELYSGQTLQEWGAVNLTTREWFDRWQQFQATNSEFHKYNGPNADPDALEKVLRLRLEFNTTWGKWQEAAKIMSTIIAMDPTHFRDYYDLSALQAMNGDVEGFNLTCREMINRFGESAKRSPYLAEQLAKTCLLIPNPKHELGPAVALAAIAVDSTENSDAFPWFIFTRALTHYREGQFAEAKTRLDEFYKLSADENSYLLASAQALSALVQHDLGDMQAARESLRRANEIVTKELPQPDNATFFAHDWPDWLRCLILIREASSSVDQP